MDSNNRNGNNKDESFEKSRKIKLILSVVIFAAIIIYAIADPTGFNALISRFRGEDIESAETVGETAEANASPSVTAANGNSHNTAATAAPNAALSGKLEVYFLDVGQGDSIFLRSPNGKTMLIDTSESKYYDVIDSFLKEQGVTKLDAVVATHPHSDHIGGMAKIIRNYDIGVFYISPVEHTTSTYENMISALEERNVDTVAVYADDMSTIAWDDNVTVRVLSPFKNQDYDLNNWSIVLNVIYGSTSVLLTGDAEEPAETVMLEKLPAEYFKATILKLGHHGSSTSSSAPFWKAVSPEAVAIEVGEGNDYGHPHRETLEMLAKWGGPVYRTDLNGTIHFTLDGKSYSVKTEK